MARSSTGDEMAAGAVQGTQEAQTAHGLRRRGIIAGAAALAAGLLAREAVTPEHVAAANGDPILLGQVNGSLNGTTIFLTSGVGQASNINTLQVIPLNYNGQANNGFYAAGVNNGTGVTGNGGTPAGSGVVGLAGGASAPGGFAGVVGASANIGLGIYGLNSSSITPSNYSNIVGVYGQSYSANGVVGVTNADNANYSGVYGIAFSSASSGVQGHHTGGGPGVYGTSPTGIGVYGISGGGPSAPYGVVGTVQSAPGFALYGVASVSGTVGFNAGASVPGAIAGQFSGPVNIYNAPATGTPITTGDLYVQRNFQVSGTKSAAVPHPDGTHRLLYCVESPEAWFEDFGTGTITGGKGEVKLDPDFAAVVDTRELHVFLTPTMNTPCMCRSAARAASRSLRTPPAPGQRAA